MEASWESVEPNSGHYAIVELRKIGKLKFLISQNVDNLHLKSGIRPGLLAVEQNRVQRGDIRVRLNAGDVNVTRNTARGDIICRNNELSVIAFLILPEA